MKRKWMELALQNSLRHRGPNREWLCAILLSLKSSACCRGIIEMLIKLNRLQSINEHACMLLWSAACWPIWWCCFSWFWLAPYASFGMHKFDMNQLRITWFHFIYLELAHQPMLPCRLMFLKIIVFKNYLEIKLIVNNQNCLLTTLSVFQYFNIILI